MTQPQLFSPSFSLLVNRFSIDFFIATFVDVLLDTAAVVDEVVALLDWVVDQSPVFVQFLMVIMMIMMLVVVINPMMMMMVMNTEQGYMDQ